MGRALAYYLSKPRPKARRTTFGPPARLAATLRPRDVLLVKGDSRVSTAIKYLTQSTWLHAALYIGGILGRGPGSEEPRVLVEADIVAGVCAVPPSVYAGAHTRICRPVSLSDEDHGNASAVR